MARSYCSPWIWLAASACVSGCFGDQFANPYDQTRASNSVIKKGQIVGRVELEGTADHGGVTVRIEPASGGLTGDEVTTQGSSAGDQNGAFASGELLPGRYDVALTKPGFDPVTRAGNDLAPGQVLDLGLTRLSAARGAVAGRVAVVDAATSGGVRVVLTSAGSGPPRSYAGFTVSDGSYLISDLPAGDYTALADLDGYTPDRSDPVTVAAEHSVANPAPVPDLQLVPATSVLKVTDSARNELRFTASRDVVIEIAPFGARGASALSMRLSEEPAIASIDEAALPFENFADRYPMQLTASEGEHRVYAQFRWRDNGEPVATIFSASVVFDRTAPRVDRIAVNNGRRYVTSDAATIPVAVNAYDAHSWVDAFLFVEQGVSAGALHAIESLEPSLLITDLLALSPGEGEKRIGVQLKDRAGNISSPPGEAGWALVVVDDTPPTARAGMAAVEVVGVVGGQLPGLTAAAVAHVDTSVEPDPERLLVLYSTGGAVSAPCPAEGAPVAPYAYYVEALQAVTFTGNHGDTRRVYARVCDGAGNSVDLQSEPFALNLRGSIRGQVLVEGVASGTYAHGGVHVSATPVLGGTSAGIDTSSDGAFRIDDLPAASYLLRFSRSGLRDVVLGGVAVQAGALTDVGTVNLTLARGSLTGVFRKAALQAGEDHSRILVELRHPGGYRAQGMTGADGEVLIEGVPERVADAGLGEPGYELVASAAGFASFALTQVSIERDRATAVSTDAAPIVLARRAGDFEVCRQAPVAGVCPAIEFTSTTPVHLNLRAQNVTHVRIAERSPFADPTDASDPSFQPYPKLDGSSFTVDLSDPDGRRTIYVQFKDDRGDADPGNDTVGAVLQASVVLDRMPPTDLAVKIVRADFAGSYQTVGPADECVHTRSARGQVRLALKAVEDPNHGSGVAIARIGRQPDFAGASSVAYAALLDHELDPTQTLGDGTYHLHVGFCDGAGNCTPPNQGVSKPVIVDRVAPTTVNGLFYLADTSAPQVTRVPPTAPDDGVYDTYLNSTSFPVLIRVGTDPEPVPGVGAVPEVAELRASLDPLFVGQPFVAVPSTVAPGGTMALPSVGISAAQGGQRIYFQFRDHAGNETPIGVGNPHHFDVILDTLPPGVSFALDDGALYSNDPDGDVTLTVVLSPVDPPVKVWLSQDGGLFDVYQERSLPLSDTSFHLSDSGSPPSDGVHAVYARFFDVAGNQTERSDSIILDRVPPLPGNPALQIDDAGSGHVRTTSVAVLLQVAGAVEMELSENPDFGGATWVAYADRATFGLSPGQGTKTVHACFRDAAGNIDAACAADVPLAASVVLDTDPPTVSATLNNGANQEPTSSRAVTVHVTASDNLSGLSGVALGDASFACSQGLYQPLPSGGDIVFTLTPGDGPRHVYLCGRDRVGNTTTAAVATGNSVYLDTQAPAAGVLTLAAGATHVRSAVVSFEISGGDPSLLVQLAGDLSAGAGTYWYGADQDGSGGYGVLPATLTLSKPNDIDTVSAVFVDGAGNASTQFSDAITVDTVAPDPGTVTLAGGQSTVNTQTIAINIADTAPDSMRFWEVVAAAACGDQACGAGFVPFAPATSFTLSAGVGDKRVCWKFCDLAGNDTAVAWRDIALGTYIARPLPELERIWPRSIMGLSSSSYTVYAVGRGFATDSKVLMGDYELNADCALSGDLAGTTCTAANIDGTSCDGTPDCRNCCAVALDGGSPAWDLTRRSGTYLVRVVTPAPVQGTGVSEQSDFFSVVAPIPEVVDFTVLAAVPPACAAGDVTACALPYHRQRYVMESTAPQSFGVLLWGRKLMQNANVRIGAVNALVQYVEDDPAAPAWDPARQVVLAEFVEFPLPPAEEPYPLLVENINPGGGEAITGFGVNWDNRIVADHVLTRIRKTDFFVRAADRFEERFNNPFDNLATASRVESGPELYVTAPGLDIAARDLDDALLYRLPAGAVGLGMPLGIGAKRFDGAGALGPGVWAMTAFDFGIRSVPLGDWDAVRTSAVGNEPHDVAVADLDGDGYADFVVPNFADDTVTLLKGGGSWVPSLMGSFRSSSGPHRVAIADFDGDDKLDIAVLNYTSRQLTIRRGDLYALDQTYGVEADPSELVVGDFDRDSVPDIAVSNRASNNLNVFIGRGNAVFAGRVSYATGNGPADLAAGDLNGDGLLDLVTANVSAATVSVLLGKGDGTFAARSDFTAGDNAYGVALADYDNDGALDVVVANDLYFDQDNLRLLRNDGSGGLSTPDAYPAGTAYLKRAIAADLDGDGNVDVAALSSWGNIAVWFGNGDGTLQPVVRFDLCGEPPGMASTDLDRDGVLDLVGACGSDDQIVMLPGSGRRQFVAQSTYPLSTYPNEVAVADLDRDGYSDLAGTNNHGNLDLLIANGDGTFRSRVTYSMTSSRSATIGDYDGDGVSDVAAVDGDNDLVRIYRGNGDGTLVYLASYSTGLAPEFIASADFDGDGDTDLVTADNGSDTASVLIGNGDATFGPPFSLTTGHEPRSIAVADFDNDGCADLAAGNGGELDAARAVSLFLGNGDGTFGAERQVNLVRSPHGLVAADFNADGRIDLATTGFWNNVVSVALGRGDGTFDAAANYAIIGGRPTHVAAADFDGDGVLDLAATNSDNVFLSVLPGRPDGTFGPQVLYNVGSSPVFVAAGDFNNDSIIDAVAVNGLFNNGGVTVLVPSVYPKPVRQELRDMPPATVAVPTGSSSLALHQATQEVLDLGVKLAIEFSQLPSGSVTTSLTAPDGQVVALATHSTFTAWPPPPATATSWRLIAHYPTTPTTGDLALLHKVQPAGDWVLGIDNATGQVAELADYAIITRGRLYGPQRGDRADMPEQIVLSPGSTGRLLHGDKAGYRDSAELSCAATHADRDGDGAGDGPPDHFYSFALPAANTVDISVLAAFDVVLELRQGLCAGETVLACADDSGGKQHAASINRALDAGSYCIVVDGKYDDNGTPGDPADDIINDGPYQLQLRFASPI
ncbi:MAG: VCBS repeat-containing protein [Deltaproteobacteria bacterium]|nr:VCBS repeat-containing protein [Deltaproteobacteria bacterium]